MESTIEDHLALSTTTETSEVSPPSTEANFNGPCNLAAVENFDDKLAKLIIGLSGRSPSQIDMYSQQNTDTAITLTTNKNLLVTEEDSTTLNDTGQNLNMKDTTLEENVVSKLDEGASVSEGSEKKIKSPRKKIQTRKPDFRSVLQTESFVLDSKNVSVTDSEETYFFTVSRDLSFSAPKENVVVVTTEKTIEYHVKGLTDELKDELTKFAPKIIGKVQFTKNGPMQLMAQTIRRMTEIDRVNDRKIAELSCDYKLSTIWSVHKDYQPEKRFVLDINPAFRPLLRDQYFLDFFNTANRYMKDNSNCPIKQLDTWLFVPREWIDVHFNRSILCSKNIQPYSVYALISCVSNQPHGRKQYPKLISMLTTIELMSIKYRYKTITQYIKLFWTTAFAISTSTHQNRPFGYTHHNLLEDLAKQVKILPYAHKDVGDSTHENARMMSEDFAFESNLTTEDVSSLKIEKNYEFGQVDRSIVTAKEYDFLVSIKDELISVPKANVLEIYERGLFRLINPTRRLKSCAMRRKEHLLQTMRYTMGKIEGKSKMIHKLTLSMLETASVDQAMIRTLASLPEDVSDIEYLEFVLAVSKVLYYDRRQKGLMLEWKKLLELFEDHMELRKFDQLLEKIDTTDEGLIFVSQLSSMIVARNILMIMAGQNEAWHMILYNEEYRDFHCQHIQYLRELRKMIPHVTMDEKPHTSKSSPKKTKKKEKAPPPNETEQPKEEELGFFRKTWTNVKNTFGRPMQVLEKHNETCTNLDDMIEQFKDQMQEVLGESDLKSYVKVVKTFNFSSISGGVESVSQIINVMFQKLVDAIAGLFGIEYEAIHIDATVLLFYYMVWRQTDSRVIKTWIVFDILARCKILDAVWNILARFWKYLQAKLTNKETANYEEIMEQLAKEQQALEKREEKAKDKCVKPEAKIVEEEESFCMDSIIDAIAAGTPAVLGALGISIVAYFGYKASSSEQTGIDIVKMMRSVGFIGMGILAVPKIYQSIVSVVKWSIDFVKSKVNSNFKTADQITREIIDWTKETATYQPGWTERAFALNEQVCIKHDLLMNRGICLATNIHQVENPAVVMAFRGALNRMSTLAPYAKNFLNIHAGCDEPMNIVFAGSPGVGKTDLSKRIAREIGVVMTGREVEPYPLNDALSYMDNYAGQQVGILDDEAIFSNPDQSSIIQKIMMYSGNATICNMASLTAKGTIMKFKLVVTNTNSPFAPVEKMLEPNALYRRRHLIYVKVNPKYDKNAEKKTDADDQAKKKTVPKINEELLESDGLSRSASDHLLFIVGDPLDSTKSLIMDGSQPRELTITELIAYLTAVAQRHKLTESVRAKQSGVDKTVLRNIIQEIEEMQASTDMKESTVNLLLKLKAQLELYETYYTTKHEAQSVVKAMLDETTGNAQDLLTDEAVHLQLIQNERGWTVEKSGFPQHLQIGDAIDPKGFVIGERLSDELLYKTDIDLSRSQQETLLYWFSKMVASQNMTEIKRIKKHITKESTAVPYFKSWSQKVKDTISSIISSSAGFLFDVGKRAIKMIGEALCYGICTAVAIVGMFLALSGILDFFAPKETASYSGKAAKTHTTSSTYYSNTLKLAETAVYELNIRTRHDLGIKTTKFQAVAIGGENFLVNKHSSDRIEQGSTVHVFDPIAALNKTDYVPASFSINPEDVSAMECDAAVITIRGFRPTRVVRHHFVKESDLGENMCNFADFDGAFISSTEGKTTYTDRQHLSATEYGTPTTVKTNYRRNIRINSPVPVGTSGALLVHFNTKIERPFLGIIMSSNEFTSYGIVITQEMIESALKRVHPVYKIAVEQPLLEPLEDHPLKNVITGLETFKSNQPNQSISLDCEFKKSPIHGAFPVISQPAIVNPKDSRCEGKNHPYSVALNKYSAPPLIVTREELTKGTQTIFNLYNEIPNISTVRIYSTVEAITGTRSQGSTSLDTSTSPGLPYKERSIMKGKTEFIRHNQALDSWEISDVIFEDVRLYEESYANYHVPLNYKCEFVKHELVGESKITTPKTRTVGTGNVIHLILYRKMFSDLYRLEKLHTRGRNHCAIGINPESKDWDCLAIDNLEYLSNIISIDVKSWESVVDLNLLRAVTEAKIQVIEKAYRVRGKELDYKLREIAHSLAVDYTDSFVCFTDIIVRKRHGMLSGHPGTLPENSDIHALLLFTIWCRRMKQLSLPGLATYNAWRHHMRIIVAGDDCLIGLSNKGRSLMSVDDLVSIYKDIGMTVTAADKSDHYRFDRIEDVEFLKMGFKLTEFGYQMYPNESIYHQLFNWVRKGKMPFQTQFQTNVLTAMRFAFFRGPQEYNKIYIQLNDALAKNSQKAFTISYQEMGAIIGRDTERTLVEGIDTIVDIMAEGSYDERPTPLLTNY